MPTGAFTSAISPEYFPISARGACSAIECAASHFYGRAQLLADSCYREPLWRTKLVGISRTWRFVVRCHGPLAVGNELLGGLVNTPISLFRTYHSRMAGFFLHELHFRERERNFDRSWDVHLQRIAERCGAQGDVG
jgi:hypothetical protein